MCSAAASEPAWCVLVSLATCHEILVAVKQKIVCGWNSDVDGARIAAALCFAVRYRVLGYFRQQDAAGGFGCDQCLFFESETMSFSTK